MLQEQERHHKMQGEQNSEAVPATVPGRILCYAEDDAGGRHGEDGWSRNEALSQALESRLGGGGPL